jgi:hypothetical protein
MRSIAARVLAHENTQSPSAMKGRNRSITSPCLSSVRAALSRAFAAGKNSSLIGPTLSFSSTVPAPRITLARAWAPCCWYCFFVRPRGSKCCDT